MMKRMNSVSLNKEMTMSLPSLVNTGQRLVKLKHLETKMVLNTNTQSWSVMTHGGYYSVTWPTGIYHLLKILLYGIVP